MPDNKAYLVDPAVSRSLAELVADPAVKTALDLLEQDHDRRVAEQIEINQIASPPFGEADRAADFARRLEELGLDEVGQDEVGNVLGRLKGGDGPTLAISAHLDTVFPDGYDPTVRIDDNGVLHAPGIADDAAGLAILPSLVRAVRTAGLKPGGDWLIVGTVGEEGRGDLRGAKHLFKSRTDIDAFISVDGEGAADITYLGLGSQRFKFTFTGPGGHSFGAFGKIPSPIQAMGRAIAKIADLDVPDEPRTTFTVSVVEGGASVNSIADRCSMLTDARSVDPDQLTKTVSLMVNLVKAAVIEENVRWDVPYNSPDNIKLEIELIGDRPSGFTEAGAVHVQAAWAAAEALGLGPNLAGPSSTDSNIPINLGIPALTLGRGGVGERSHSLTESFDPTDAHLAAQRILLTGLALTGLTGRTEPLLTA